jgi:hypothetical protein
MIPPEVLKFWANCFKDGTLHDEYADELHHLLNFIASNTEFNMTLQDKWGNFWDEKIH